ncbi:ABC transporter permease subunit [Alcaligenaceae bacterium CGII-47]|nr:ABC transporter permease subunit [Alcaligenaceae bacterium CGII-47]
MAKVSPKIPTRCQSHRERGDALILLIVLLAAWQIASLVLGAHVMPAPYQTWLQLVAEIRDPDFYLHLEATVQAFSVAILIAMVFGVMIGLILGARRLAGDVMEPVLITLYSIPKIALYPVILLIFGLDISAKIAFGVIHGIIPIILFTVTAVRNIPAVYMRTSRSYRLGAMASALHVLIPAAMPEIVAGLRIGFSLTLLGTLLGEMFASQYGIGHLLMRAMERNETSTIMALALMLFLFATVASYGLLKLDRYLRH